MLVSLNAAGAACAFFFVLGVILGALTVIHATHDKGKP
jgi:hypothetical protein